MVKRQNIPVGTDRVIESLATVELSIRFETLCKLPPVTHQYFPKISHSLNR